eukprot:Blabericola_migrator_1__5395@NODE_2763_length_2380_cov_9_632080_g1729_i0_p2_GENE_NODE_2763_length_2380_cov_9_632080_g1729_i0NODE_2763_length_2380_cov_9_632080_g1729_i0_p2_ORF_typecomplete_len159_score0_97SecD_SecF/PF02355_16/1_6e20MMPL/PF03176_15/2_2e05ACR_tran/PF00873_19/0_82_NODE_2763_length_2380_cov_9_632080_g1729_i012901766
MQAALWGLILLALLMFRAYPSVGFVTILSLGIFVCLCMSVLSLFPHVTLTVPAIAGLLLATCLFLDSHILLLEELPTQLYNAKSTVDLVTHSYHRVKPFILTTHLFLGGWGLLFAVAGTGPIKVFGLPLLVGVCNSLFTTLTYTKSILRWRFQGKTAS